MPRILLRNIRPLLTHPSFHRNFTYALDAVLPMADDDLSSLADAKPAGELQNGISSNTGLIHLGDDKMEPIAVIGFAARLPGDATSAEGFWQMLSEGRSARTEIPKDRFNIDAFYHSDNDRIDTVSASVHLFRAMFATLGSC